MLLPLILILMQTAGVQAGSQRWEFRLDGLNADYQLYDSCVSNAASPLLASCTRGTRQVSIVMIGALDADGFALCLVLPANAWTSVLPAPLARDLTIERPMDPEINVLWATSRKVNWVMAADQLIIRAAGSATDKFGHLIALVGPFAPGDPY